MGGFVPLTAVRRMSAYQAWDDLLVSEEDGGRFDWDFFVSYTQADRLWAEWVAWRLEADGHRVLVQAWDFVPGSNWISRMQDGAAKARRTIALLSAAYLKSEYGSAEWQAAWGTDPAGRDRRLLTVRVEDCERPGLLASVVGIDLIGVPEETARRRLADMVARALAGRAKPVTAPLFPPAGRAIPHEPRFPGVLPQVWEVPAHNPAFTGRTADLQELDAALTVGTTVTVQSVRGMAGVGKTQLATEYAHRHAARYDLVWWVAAEQPALIADQFARLAAELGLDPGPDADAVRVATHGALRGVRRWLLVFDNADVVDDVRPWIPAAPRAPGEPGHVLVTTRRGGFAELGAVLDLDVMYEIEGLALLARRVTGLHPAVGRQLGDELGWLPLALEQAAAYIDQTRIPPAEYLELLIRRGDELHTRGRVPGRPDTIATQWDLAVQRISTGSPAAADLLGI